MIMTAQAARNLVGKGRPGLTTRVKPQLPCIFVRDKVIHEVLMRITGWSCSAIEEQRRDETIRVGAPIADVRLKVLQAGTDQSLEHLVVGEHILLFMIILDLLQLTQN